MCLVKNSAGVYYWRTVRDIRVSHMIYVSNKIYVFIQGLCLCVLLKTCTCHTGLLKDSICMNWRTLDVTYVFVYYWKTVSDICVRVYWRILIDTLVCLFNRHGLLEFFSIDTVYWNSVSTCVHVYSRNLIDTDSCVYWKTVRDTDVDWRTLVRGGYDQ